MALIRLVNVHKSFLQGDERRVVLDGASASFNEGAFIAVRGRSGSGKTTLLNLVAGLDVPDQGEIWIDDRDLATLGDKQRTLVRRRSIGIVFQFFNLIPTLNVLENVMLPAELAGQPAAELEARARDLLDRVGLSDRAQTAPDELSGGEQQRVAVARSLVVEPRLVLADEPTGNLDLDTGVQVLDLLEELTRDLGKTLLVATHSHELAERADQVFTILDGELVPLDEKNGG